jgi:acyl-coenzyme A synthetase/AMP-(fatty) acid ligase
METRLRLFPAYPATHRSPFDPPTNLASVVSRHQKQRLTYEHLDLKSNALARGLAAGGVAKGDRVAVSLGNSIEYAIVWPLSVIGECEE